MKLKYLLTIENPQFHIAKVRLTGKRSPQDTEIEVFIPSWSPGSYLMREYCQNIKRFQASTSNGEVLHFKQKEKGVWAINWEQSKLKIPDDSFEVTYEVYCHELTVRTSHIDESHAFIHGPSVFMGVLNKEISQIELQVKFPPLWSKISTGLKELDAASTKREDFIYTAPDYDTFIDAPIEIGCHETDGFMYQGRPHELAFYGSRFESKENFKKDIEIIVDTIAKTMKDIPYEKYTIISHFVPGKFGGLEHLNSTALQYCPMKIVSREGYLNWLALVAHEYFHTWNIKRIRPKNLGPFDYTKEAMTSMLWLAEGLTSFMDEVFVLRSGLCSLDEYLEMQKNNLNRYYATPGRRFDSLEDSSFNAWVRLYRPNENSNNVSISYYLKGGIVFWALNTLLIENGSSMNALLTKLWEAYKECPEAGLESAEVYKMVEELAGEKVSIEFQRMITTTEDIDLEAYFKKTGLLLEYEASDKAHLGATFDFPEGRVLIKSVVLDGPAYKSGLNAGDELLAINGMRIFKADIQKLDKFLFADKSYEFLVSRLNHVEKQLVTMGKSLRIIKNIKVLDKSLAEKVLL